MAKFITADEYINMRECGITPRYDVISPRLHISAGNSKTGAVRTFNKLAGHGIQCDASGRPLCGVLGSCPFNCEGCYACASQALARENVIVAWGENTLLARGAWFYDYLRDYFKENPAKYGREPFRIHSSGELESVEELRAWVCLAYEFRSFRFYTYTKRFDILREYMAKYCDEYGYDSVTGERVYLLSELININLSECDGYPAPDDLKKFFPVFVWDTGQMEAANMPHCPAVLPPACGRKKGARNKAVTCVNNCGRCWSGKSTAVNNH